MTRRTLGFVLVLALGFGPGTACAEPPRGEEEPSLNDVSLEVAALQAIYQFRMTPDQLQQLRKLAADTMQPAEPREAVKASEKYRKTLLDLRTALVQAKDEEHIAKLQEQLDQLTEDEEPQLDDGVELTEAACARAPELLRSLSARQVAAYVAGFGEDFPDPVGQIRKAMDEVRGLDAETWKAYRTEVPGDIGRLVVGLDGDRAGEVADRVVQLLIQVRALKDDEFKKERPELDKSAREIVGTLGPLDVMRNVLERNLAELLSNPRLEKVLDERLKAGGVPE